MYFFIPHSLKKIHTLKLRWPLAIMLAIAIAMHLFALPRFVEKSVRSDKAWLEQFTDMPPPEKQPNWGKISVPHQSGYLPMFLPHILEPNQWSNHTYRFVLHYAPWQTRNILLSSLTCVKNVRLNGNTISSHESSHNCRDRFQEIIKLHVPMRPGNNLLEVVTSAEGLYIEAPIFGSEPLSLGYVLGFLFYLCACFFVALLTRQTTGSWIAGLIMAAALTMYMHRMALTHFMDFPTDMPGHLTYATHILKTHSIPNPFKGWVFYHPPLYYLLQAFILQTGNWLGSFDTITLVRLFSITCVMTHLLYSLRMLRMIVTHPLAYHAGALLIALYPSAFLHASQINSNLLFYALYSVSLYHLLCWIKKKEPRSLALAMTFTGLSFATRANTLILLPLLAAAALYVWYKDKAAIKAHMRAAICWLAALVLLAGIGAGIGRTAYYKYHSNSGKPVLVSNVGVFPERFRTENTAANLLSFDLKSYFDSPYFSPWFDSTGRQNLFSSLLKSSLFGSFQIGNSKDARELCQLLVLLLLGMLNGILLGFTEFRKHPMTLPVLCACFTPIVAIICMRLLFPFGSSQHFRYIYPVSAAFAALLAIVIESLLARERYYAAALLAALSVTFVVKSYVIYWPA
jgi:hypothetical protein